MLDTQSRNGHAIGELLVQDRTGADARLTSREVIKQTGDARLIEVRRQGVNIGLIARTERNVAVACDIHRAGVSPVELDGVSATNGQRKVAVVTNRGTARGPGGN